MAKTNNTELSRQEKRLFTLNVNRYLTALGAADRARPRDKIEATLAEINGRLSDRTLSPVHRLEAIQARIDALNELDAALSAVELKKFQKEFVQHAKVWAEDKGISYAAFRELGVPVDVLKEAGIER